MQKYDEPYLRDIVTANDDFASWEGLVVYRIVTFFPVDKLDHGATEEITVLSDYNLILPVKNMSSIAASIVEHVL